LKQRIINYLFRNVVKVVLPEDVIVETNSGLYLGKSKLTEIELRSLQSEAKAIQSTRLWSILNETVKQRAYEKGWRDSTSIEHLNTAKTMGYVLDLQASIINKFIKKTS